MIFDKRLLFIAAGSLLGVTFIFYVVSNAVPSWSRLGNEQGEVTYGLWQNCVTISDLKICSAPICPLEKSSTGSYCRKILAARAFATLACITCGMAALSICLSMVTTDNIKQILLITGKGLTCVCLVMGIIGVVVGIDASIGASIRVTTDLGLSLKPKLGAASIIGILAMIINLCGAIVSLLI